MLSDAPTFLTVTDISGLNPLRAQSVPSEEGLAVLEKELSRCKGDSALDLVIAALLESAPWWRGERSDAAIMKLNQTNQNIEWFT
jgi:hypothetical protein